MHQGQAQGGGSAAGIGAVKEEVEDEDGVVEQAKGWRPSNPLLRPRSGPVAGHWHRAQAGTRDDEGGKRSCGDTQHGAKDSQQQGGDGAMGAGSRARVRSPIVALEARRRGVMHQAPSWLNPSATASVASATLNTVMGAAGGESGIPPSQDEGANGVGVEAGGDGRAGADAVRNNFVAVDVREVELLASLRNPQASTSPLHSAVVIPRLRDRSCR